MGSFRIGAVLPKRRSFNEQRATTFSERAGVCLEVFDPFHSTGRPKAGAR
jgi:hypothetical protein